MALGALLLAAALPAGAANTPPVAADDQVVVHGWGRILLDVLANDYDEDGDPLTVTVFAPLTGVGVSKSSAEVVVITPTQCLASPTSFEYEVDDGEMGTDRATVHLVPGNCTNSDPNVNPDVFEVMRNTVLPAANVLANDTDPEGDGLRIIGLTSITRGTATISGDGKTVRFVPELDYVGAEAGFHYTVVDSQGATATAPASVLVQDPSSPQGDELVAVRGKILVIDASTLLVNDPSAVSLVAATADQGERVDFIEPPAGDPVLLYHAPASGSSPRTLTYTVEDASGNQSTGTATILLSDPVGTMRAADDFLSTLKDGCLLADFDHLVSNDIATGEGVQDFQVLRNLTVGGLQTVFQGPDELVVSYQVPQGYVGRDFFQYRVDDEFGSDLATVVIDLLPAGSIPLTPVAVDDDAVTETQSLTIPVLRNDYSPDCSPITLTSVTAPTQGTAGISGSVNVFYNPYSGATGTDSFQYVIDNVHGDDTGTVEVKLADTVPPPRPVINYDRYGCQHLSTCAVTAEQSRHGDGAPYSKFYSVDGVTPNCVTGWYFDDSLSPPHSQPIPDPLSCYTDVFDHHPVQSLNGRYSEPGLYLMDLVLLDYDHREEVQRWVPVGATTRPEITVSCNREQCSFSPGGSFPDGVVTRFEWRFHGAADPDPVVLDEPDEVVHVFNGAQVGDEFDVWLTVERFDGTLFSRHRRVTIQERLPTAPQNVTVLSDVFCFASGPMVAWTAPLDFLVEGFRVWRQVEGQPSSSAELVAELGPVETRIFDAYGGSSQDTLLYTVESFGPTGASPAASVSGSPTTVSCAGESVDPQTLASPALLQWSLVEFGEIQLQWTDRASNESSHRVLESIDGAAFQILADLPVDSTSLTVSGLEVGREYRYQVEARDASRVSDRTGIATVKIPDDLLVDGFEDGTTGRWAQRVSPGDALRIASGGRLGGSFGLRAPARGTEGHYVVDESPQREPRYRARFRLAPGDLELHPAGGVDLLEGLDEVLGETVFFVSLSANSSPPLALTFSGLVGGQGPGTAAFASVGPVLLHHEVYDIEVEWWAASAPGANDGGVRLWVDGVLHSEALGIETSAHRLDTVRFGVQSRYVAPVVESDLWLDEFASRRSSRLDRAGLSGEVLTDSFDLLDPLRWSSIITAGAVEPEVVESSGGGATESYLHVPISPGGKSYIETPLESGERHLLLRFDLGLPSLQLVNGGDFKIVVARSAEDDQRLFELLLQRSSSGDLELVAIGREGAGGAVLSAPLPWQSTMDTLELEWWAASAPGAADGRVILRHLGSGESVEIQGLTNDQRTVRTLRLGAAAGVGPTADGALQFDNLWIWR
ncbi:MAG: Ig-like domain-containing protein [Acidobacteriota bacterium]